MYILTPTQVNNALIIHGKQHQKPEKIVRHVDYCEYFFNTFVLVHYKSNKGKSSCKFKIKELSPN